MSEDVFVFSETTDLSSIPTGLTSLRIDSSVKRIPPRAFSEQTNLTIVEYEEGLEVIGEKAFYHCFGLREQQFPSTLIEIGKLAFCKCEQLESVGLLPPGLMIIGERAFIECRKLRSIELPNDAIHLGDGAFQWCSSLTHFRLPRGMVTIPQGLFFFCQSLVDIDIPSSVIHIEAHAFSGCQKLAMIALPEGLKTIGRLAFESTGLMHFHCPTTVESMGDNVFDSCTQLKTVIFPPKLEVISSSTLRYCKYLENISMPQSLSRIGQYAFSDFGLTQLDLSPLNLTSIGKFAFAYCSNLRDITLPRFNLKRIEDRCFEGCKSLTHLWVPPTVDFIDNGAFADCISLLSVEVPETLKRVVFIGWNDEDSDDEDDQEDLQGDLCGYESLVNIHIPKAHQLDHVSNLQFMNGMKLSEAEGSYPELVEKLRRRFSHLPLQHVCYFQSYHSLQESITKIRGIVSAAPGACGRVDFLGMTPFHILALSHRPNLDLFQELLSTSSVEIFCRDVFGATPFDYLCKNHSTPAVSMTKSLLSTIIEPRVSFLGLDSWRDEVTSGLEKVQQKADATSLSTEVACVAQKFAQFEQKEVFSLLESSIWRLKVDEDNATGSDARESCRINCGSSIVLKNVIPFLGRNN